MHPEVPGLYIFDSFFNEPLCKKIIQESLAINDQLEKNNALFSPANTANIPQPDLVKQEEDKLNNKENFFRITIHDADELPINGEYFPRYGEEGHILAYFRGNENLPHFAKALIPSIKSLIAEHDIVTRNIKDSWRLTMNFYKNISGVVSGFPFHVDIPANGVITMIMNIHREAEFQITNGDKIIDIHLPVGTLLILSGESRYKWKHRVLPSQSQSEVENAVERISLVLGVK